MPIPTQADSELTKDLRRRVNRYLLDLVGELQGTGSVTDRFRRAIEVDEALEPASLVPFDINSSTRHIDLGRITASPAHFLEGLLNGDVPVRRFERVVDEQLILAIDVTRSMRYPLRELYAEETSKHLPQVLERPGQTGERSLPPFEVRLTKTKLDRQDLLWAKPSLAKLVSGALLQSAAASGFKVRIVRFGLRRVEASPLISDTFSLDTDLFQPFDRALRHAKTATPRMSEPRAIERLLAHLDQYRGTFVIVSDFIAPSYLGRYERDWRRWRRVCGLLRDFALRRRLVIARVNQEEEVCEDPPWASSGNHDLPNAWLDLCEHDLEHSECDPRGREPTQVMAWRLANQARWQRRLERALRPCCRGYLAADNWHARVRLRNQLWRMWTRLLES